jgi:hypothetical protein
MKLAKTIVPYRLELKIKEYVSSSDNYRHDVNSKQLKEWSDHYRVPYKDILSIRSAYIKDKIMIGYSYLRRNRKKIAKEYDHNNILALSKKYNNSPLTLFRVILRGKGYSKEQVKKILQKPSLMKPIDYEQYKIAEKNDSYASIDNQRQKEKSIEFEKRIEQMLIDHRINYIPERKLEGLTPDFLIKDNLLIDKKPIHWIDAKNYFGANSVLNQVSLRKQARKYNRAFGNGAFIFLGGYSEKLDIENTYLFAVNH